MNYPYILVASIVFLSMYLFLAFRASFIYRGFTYRISAFLIYKVTLAVAAVNTISPFKSAGLVLRPLFFKKRALIPYKSTMSVIFVEQMVDVMSRLLIFVAGIYLLGTSGDYNVIGYVVIILVLFSSLIFIYYFKSAAKLAEFALGIAKRFLPNKVKNWLQGKKVHIHHFSDLVRRIHSQKNKTRNLLVILLLSSFTVFFAPFVILLFCKAFEINLSYAHSFALYWLPTILARISSIPGGFGVKEGAMVLIFNMIGIGVSRAIEISIYFRIFIMTVTIAAGVLASTSLGVNMIKLVKMRKAGLEKIK